MFKSNSKCQITKHKFPYLIFVPCAYFVICALVFVIYPVFAQGESKPPASTEKPRQEISERGNVTLDFKDADINNVLKIISYKSGVNIVTTPEVIGTVTIRLKDVPWEKALETIVKTYGFGYQWLGNKVILVSTLDKLAEQRKAQQEAGEREPLEIRTFVLNFSNAEEVKDAIEKIVSPRGKIAIESRTNTLIISDTRSNLINIDQVIRSLDKVTPQVLVEVKIIETTLGDTEKLGIDWSMRVAVSGSTRPTTFPFTETIKGTGSKMFPNVQVPRELEQVNTTVYSETGTQITTSKEEKVWNKLVPGFPAVTADKFLFGTLDFSEFKMVLEILKSSSDTKIISNPSITTLNNHSAKMFVGSVVPIPNYEFSKDTGTRVIKDYSIQEIGIKLKVVPNINEQNYITLDINPSVDEISGWTGPNNERPIISSRSAETKVMIKDGQTLVMGGLISETKVKSSKKVPLLGDLPMLGLLFRKKEDTTAKTDLLIFITPHIVKESLASSEGLSNLSSGSSEGVPKDKQGLLDTVVTEAAVEEKKK